MIRMHNVGKSYPYQRTTIIQVTHDERVAAYGQRIIRLADGWLSDEGSG